MYASQDQEIDSLASLFGKADVVPVITRMPGDLLTPLAAYCALSEGNERSFLFESVEGGEHLARYSFIGADPVLSVRDEGSELRITNEGVESTSKGSILAFLRESLPRLTFPDFDDLPLFLGGAVGFLDFNISREIEPVLSGTGNDREGRVGSEFMFFRHVVAFDHVKQAINLVSLVFSENARNGAGFRSLIVEAYRQNERTAAKLSKGFGPARSDKVRRNAQASFDSNFSKEEFEGSVRKIKELIAAGECYQVVLSQCFSKQTTATSVELYRALRSLNPSPYMFLMDLGSRSVIGASPEMLVRCRGDKLEYRPIAGTRPRGKSRSEDEALADEMLADEKELSEHRMLVDLGRNDLGRVSEYGSVVIDDLMSVEKFSHVQHITSSVSSTLRRGLDGFHALASCFPAGTVSGAPKVRAMEIISELEPTERGIYSGAVGYFDHQGNLDTCIAIRTIYLENGMVKIQAGAGIVADSVPEKEFEETVHKARALMKAVEMAEGGRFAIGRRNDSGEAVGV
ncbi:MAG: anthranilate synthase component I family protein [Acidobacteria bacterium]|nr:MAG: anthranilate synthase component I family protein [Acidobacteriota bacterium]REK01550.1 MAG: anthranilate synthase component I family protein [Acidobacteriota bacterium]REK14506.1 MAG: anthranilate synthase component I family protein [Acidobacteriota bacterium]REK45221.1 MAG: anthranilate synthase component I family protein [Acidobacteriota bacterium]